MLAWPWLLPADRGLGEEAVGGEIAVCLCPPLCLCCCACGCEARFTKPSCICCGGEWERAAGTNGVAVNWDGAVSERGVGMGCTCAGSKVNDWGS
jgi:hypothetical protein